MTECSIKTVMIHRAHRLAGRKTEIYGICTDSCQWNFIHINKKGRVREPHALYKAHVHVFRSPIYHCTGCMTSGRLPNRLAALSARQLPFIKKQVEVRDNWELAVNWPDARSRIRVSRATTSMSYWNDFYICRDEKLMRTLQAFREKVSGTKSI